MHGTPQVTKKRFSWQLFWTCVVIVVFDVVAVSLGVYFAQGGYGETTLSGYQEKRAQYHEYVVRTGGQFDDLTLLHQDGYTSFQVQDTPGITFYFDRESNMLSIYNKDKDSATQATLSDSPDFTQIDDYRFVLDGYDVFDLTTHRSRSFLREGQRVDQFEVTTPDGLAVTLLVDRATGLPVELTPHTSQGDRTATLTYALVQEIEDEDVHVPATAQIQQIP